jgi:hypothetical protein
VFLEWIIVLAEGAVSPNPLNYFIYIRKGQHAACEHQAPTDQVGSELIVQLPYFGCIVHGYFTTAINPTASRRMVKDGNLYAFQRKVSVFPSSEIFSTIAGK